MKASKLREQTGEELVQSREEAKKGLFDRRVRKSTGDTSEQPLLVRALRREVARIETIMRERELAKHG